MNTYSGKGMLFMNCQRLGAFARLAVSRLKWIQVTKSAKLFKSTAQKRDLKGISHLWSWSATEITRKEFCDWKLALPWHFRQMSMLLKRLAYNARITNHERSFGSNRRVKIDRRQVRCGRNIPKFSDCHRVVRLIMTEICWLRLVEITRIDLLLWWHGMAPSGGGQST